MTELLKSINLTTVAASAITALIIGVLNLIATRYTNKVLDHLEKTIRTRKD